MTKTHLNSGMAVKSTIEQLLDRTNRDPADAHINKRAWQWTGASYTLRKPHISLTREVF